MVDKYAVKQYVADRIGREYIIPTIGVWDKPEDIDWESLPNQFVLKTTHGGGGCGVFICKDKTTFNKQDIIKKLKKSLASEIYPILREWPYKNVKKQVIAEKFIAPEKNPVPSDLPDYKFFCFNGEPKYCQVIRDRHSIETIDFYDMEWNHQEFVGLNPVARNGLTSVTRPKHLNEMADICKKLAKDIPFVRVDLYVVDEKEYFGELTFYPASGIGAFNPTDWNRKLGELLTLPKSVIGGGKFLIINSSIQNINIEYVELNDYKFFCFNGKVRFFKVDFGRFVEHHANYFSADLKYLDFGELDFPRKPDEEIDFPNNIKEMISIAEKLSTNIPFLRVDLYNVNGRIYFGECTFYPASGLRPWDPEDADKKIGEFINLTLE